jgi:hypothetical protein
MPDRKNPIQLPEVVVSAKRITPKKYREVTEKVKLYPNASVEKFKVDSLQRAGHDLGKPIQIKGQADMYGADQSDRIKKLLRK